MQTEKTCSNQVGRLIIYEDKRDFELFAIIVVIKFRSLLNQQAVIRVCHKH
jgi:hypothetical protein